MRLTISPSDEILDQYANALGALGARDGHRALARAVNRTTNTVYGRVIRAIARQSSIPARVVRQAITKRTVRPGSGGDLTGVIQALGKPLPLKVFRPRQLSYGVRVKLWGQWQRMEGTFIYAGTYRSGQEVAGGHVFQRVTTASLPIEMQRGPSVPEEMVKGESERQFEQTVADMLPQRVAHEIGRLLPS